MANASAKRTAQHNAETIKNLRMGMLASLALSLLLRVLFRRDALRPTTFAFWLYAFSLVPSVFLSRYLERIGSPRRDPTTGALISAGEDLARPGIIEWCFDVVYISWACQVGSGAFGQWVWWLYLVIPLYAVFKLWSSILSPMLGFGRGGSGAQAEADAGAEPKETVSKRQEKLRKRQERGDPRVRVQTRN
ncbi:putative opsin, partial [Lentinus tigrinus ALCF2SS1-7]|uniref:Putative opsin n=1 Tax=Lentinus tigrinus ALCF2SS1-6 TaxID=1328759 RepID=A0A5C2RMJ2_9APHY